MYGEPIKCFKIKYLEDNLKDALKDAIEDVLEDALASIRYQTIY